MEMTAREAALLALERCRRGGAWSDAVLDGIIQSAGLDRRDAALASCLCYGVQQNMMLCDFYIDAYASMRTARMEPKLLDILRISVYTMLFLDRVPDRAAVHAAVELTKRAGLGRASGLVNAVLRRVSENRDKLPAIPHEGTADYLAIRYSHPKWLVEAYLSRLGYAETEKLLELNNAVPPITAQVNTLKTTSEKLIQAGAAPHPWLPDCVILPDGGQGLAPVRDGLAYVQDAAAKLSVLAAAPQAGMTVLDACAAPGGKSFAAGMLMQNTGSILSCDLHEKKLSRICSGAERLGLRLIETRAMDARTAHQALQSQFDVVLADVPCSGLGVIRKKPDIRYKSDTEINGLPEIQLNILRGLADCVKPGGVLLYSTCTILEAENEAVCKQFLAENGIFSAEAFSLPDPVGAAQDGMLTLWPHIHGTDGFFLCKMRRST